jgi:hypothetical protein
MCSLQWGHAFGGVETHGGRSRDADHPDASMRPQFGKCGNAVRHDRLPDPDLPASMGPRLQRRGNLRARNRPNERQVASMGGHACKGVETALL